MKMMVYPFCVFAMIGGLVSGAAAQSSGQLVDKKPASDQDESDFAAKAGQDVAVFDFGATARADRDMLLKTLKTEVEANLSKADSDRLKRNVMRLGSYRSDWALEARDFLLANSPVAELYLYQFSMMKNPRLNSRIRDTLLMFTTLRYPKAALAFLSFFVIDRENYDDSLRLVQKAIKQDPSLSTEALLLFGGSLGEIMSLSERLNLASTACASRDGKIAPEAMDIVKSWRSLAKSFWEKTISAELEGCLPGS